MAQRAFDELSISGAWVLDLSRSDTFEGYLRYLGNPEHVIQAQVAGERAYQSRNVIALDNSSLVILKDTAVNRYVETFRLGEERVTDGPGGSSREAVASLVNQERLDGYSVVSTASAPGGIITMETVEARQLLEGGLAHVQHVNVRRPAIGGECNMRRTWVRVPMTPEDQMRLFS